MIKPIKCLLKEGIVHQGEQFFFRTELKLIDLKGLFQESFLQLNQVAIVPLVKGDLALRMWYFTNNSHNKVFERAIIR